MNDLSDILVISWGQAASTLFANDRLKEAGATVVSVDLPGRSGARPGLSGQQGRSSAPSTLLQQDTLCLDFSSAQDCADFERLVAKADVLIHESQVNSLGTSRLDVGGLQNSNPSLIICEILRPDSPDGDVRARSRHGGASDETEYATITPDRCNEPQWVTSAGYAGMVAFSGILQALYIRERHGEGKRILVAPHAVGEWQAPVGLRLVRAETRSEPAHEKIQLAPYGLYECHDGKFVMIVARTDQEWKRLCRQILECPKLSDEPRFIDVRARIANRVALQKIVSDALKRLDRDVVLARLAAADRGKIRPRRKADS